MTTNPPRIHVLQVLGNAIVGGMERWVEQVVQRLPREQFAVTALCPFSSSFTEQLRSLVDDVVLAPMPENPLWDSIQTATTLVQTRRIDVLHAHLPNAHLLSGIVGRMTERPVLTTIHGRQMTTLDLEVQRAAKSHVSVVCQHSYFHALSLGVEPALLSCEPSGVDTGRFVPATARSGLLRDALRLDAQVPLVGFIGRFSPEKGPEVFVRAAQRLKTLYPVAHCVLIGEGPLEPLLRQAIAEQDLGDRVHLVAPLLDMPAVFADLDLLVSSSHSEALPMVLMEAMACGLAVVATRVGGVPEMVAHGQTGWLVDPWDSESIAARAATLLQNAALRERMGQQARLRAVSRFALDSSIERVVQLLKRVAAPRGDTAPLEQQLRSLDSATIQAPRRKRSDYPAITATQ